MRPRAHAAGVARSAPPPHGRRPLLLPAGAGAERRAGQRGRQQPGRVPLLAGGGGEWAGRRARVARLATAAAQARHVGHGADMYVCYKCLYLRSVFQRLRTILLMCLSVRSSVCYRMKLT